MSKDGRGIIDLILALMLSCLVALFIVVVIGNGDPVKVVDKLWDALKKGGAISTAFGGGMVVIPSWLSAKPPLRYRIRAFFARAKAFARMQVIPLPFGFWLDISLARCRVCIVDALTGEIISLRSYLQLARALRRAGHRERVPR